MQVYHKSNCLAHSLQNNFNLSSGDIVAIILPNIPDFSIIFLGTIQAGLVVTTINPYYTAGKVVFSKNVMTVNVYLAEKCHIVLLSKKDFSVCSLTYKQLHKLHNIQLDCKYINNNLLLIFILISI